MEERSYPPNISVLLERFPVMSLKSGAPDDAVVEILDSPMLERLFGSHIIRNRTAARLCVAGLWLLSDHLERCHEIAQGIETPDGGYWHAIMHRREGDFSNSKYWYRRVGSHPIFPTLLQKAKLLNQSPFANYQTWDPSSFVDLCENAVRGGNFLETCEVIQRIEWNLLFHFCYTKAITTQ